MLAKSNFGGKYYNAYQKVLIRNNNSSTFSNVTIADSPIISGVRSIEFIQAHFITGFLILRKQAMPIFYSTTACINETEQSNCKGRKNILIRW